MWDAVKVRFVSTTLIDPTADIKYGAIVEDGAILREGATIHAFSVVQRGARVGAHSSVGSHCFVESGAVIGQRVTVKNGVQVWDGIEIGDDVFVGPNVTFTNDTDPRSRRGPGALKWDRTTFRRTRIEESAVLGAGAILLPGVRVGKRARVAAGAVVTHDVPDDGLVMGVPARRVPTEEIPG